MNPCKRCIVRACCTTDCDLYKRFALNVSTILTFLSTVFAFIVVVIPMLYLIEIYPNKEHGKEIIQWVWAFCIIFNITFGRLKIKMKALFFEIFFGPVCTVIYLFLFISSKIIKLSVPKRV